MLQTYHLTHFKKRLPCIENLRVTGSTPVRPTNIYKPYRNVGLFYCLKAVLNQTNQSDCPQNSITTGSRISP